MKILLVCTGNTCRSPFAEGLARRLASERGMSVEFDSAGEQAREGAHCPPEAVATARRHGVDLSAHRARRLTVEQRADADEVVELFDVQDPIGGGAGAYRKSYEDLREKVGGLLDRIGGSA